MYVNISLGVLIPAAIEASRIKGWMRIIHVESVFHPLSLGFR